MTDKFNEDSIRKYLSVSPEVFLNVYDCVDSTNKIAMEMAASGAPAGTVIAAASQTAGRGRLGRSFYSPCGSGIYISIILRPDAPAQDSLFLTVSTAVAVCRAIELMSDERAKIKWVNDIYMRDRKVCGILVQGAADGDKIDYAVTGIGINLLPPEEGFPNDINAVAGSVFTSSFPDMRSSLAAKVIENAMKLCRLPADRSVIDEYRRRSWLDGCSVNVIQNGSTVPAKVIGIDEECRLEIVYDDGRTDRLMAGEVSVRKTV